MLFDDEYREFMRLIRSSGCRGDDFEISETFFIGRKRMYDSLSNVIVRWIPKDTCRTYIAGCASYWLRGFENDLNNGAFAEAGLVEKTVPSAGGPAPRETRHVEM